MAIADNPKNRRINEDIAAKRFYESLQHVMSAVKRAIVLKNHEEALELLHHYAVVYIGVGEYSLSLELIKEYLTIARKQNSGLSDASVEHMISFFEAMLKSDANGKDNMVVALNNDTVMDRTVQAMEAAASMSEHPKLNRTLGKYYADRNLPVLAQKYLAYAKDAELLFSVISDWASRVDEHEKPHLYLRTVLILLAVADFESAKCFLLMLDVDFENPDELPLPLQLAHILSELSEQPDYQLFKLACKTYKPIIDSDPNFPRLISTLREILFPGHYDPSDPYCPNPAISQAENNPMTALFRSMM